MRKAITVFDQHSCRDILKAEFESRRAYNPAYSLRAFARDIGLAPARVSEFLSGKQGLSAATAKKVAPCLNMTAKETEYFVILAEIEHGRSNGVRDAAKRRLSKMGLRKLRLLSLEAFRLISNWYHPVITEMTALVDFKPDPKWIAARLELTEAEVKLAIKRLITAGIFKKKGRGFERADDSLITFPEDIPSTALKEAHRQVMEKAMAALYCQSVSERDFSSVIMAIDPDQLAEAKNLVRKFRRELNEVLSRSPKGKTRIYCFSAQLFALDQKPTHLTPPNTIEAPPIDL